MLKIILPLIFLANLLFAYTNQEFQTDYKWLVETNKKYKEYRYNPKDIYLKNYKSDGEKLNRLKVKYDAEIKAQFVVKQQFQKTVANMKGFIKNLQNEIKTVTNNYQYNFQTALDTLKKMEKEKSLNRLNDAKNSFRISEEARKKFKEVAGSNSKAVEEMKKNSEKFIERLDEVTYKVKKAILIKVRKPKSKYRGKNRKKYKKMILEAWKKAYPKDKVLSVIFHMKKFKRTKEKKWHNATNRYRYTDMSVLAVTVAVKTSKKIVTLYPAYININNMTKKLSVGVQTKGSAYIVKEMLFSKW